jgi:N-methylhydantoinase A
VTQAFIDLAASRLRIGVDSGGTFTDVCVFDETSGRIFVWKVSSTPGDPSQGIAGGIAEALNALAPGADAARHVSYFGHGTTVATNALITGRGADTGVLTTAGFRDVLEIRRQTRPELYDLQTQKPPILATRDKRLEVKERVLANGTVETPLDEAGLRAAVIHLRDMGVKAVAVCFLFSFIAPEHEARARAILAEEMPDAFISISHEIAPEFREYERLSTTVVNAYLGPIMRDYLQKLRPRLEAMGMDLMPNLTQSNGGVISCETAQAQPVRTVLSGPAAGVMGALTFGRLSQIGELITFDMGGTSTDVSLIDDYKPQMANHVEVHGYPLKVPMLDIHTVGAGGGSIAYVDNGLLKVGPRSAGASPGPVCYGLGNLEPTVTDANVVLGVLNQTHLLNGRMKIDAQASRDAVGRVAAALGLGVMETAQGIIRVVVANMAKAIRVISVERGYDPRDYVMMAFGGAGPIHAARLARELDINRVLVPKNPGLMCALGLLLTDLRTNLSMTRMSGLTEAALTGLNEGFALLDRRAEAWFAQEAIAGDRRMLSRAADMRYAGQSYELTVPCPAGELTADSLAEMRAGFERLHQQMYGYIAAEEPIQITTLRIEATGLVPKAELENHPPATGPAQAAIVTRRQVYLPETGGQMDCPVYDRDLLGPGHVVKGPAIIEQMDSTTLLLPGQTATVDAYLSLLLEH